MNAERPVTGAALLVLVGIGLGIGFNVLHPDPLPWKAQPKKTVTLDEAGVAETVAQLVEGETERETPADPRAGQRTTPAEPEPPTDVAATPTPTKPAAAKTTTPGPEGESAATDLYSDIPESEFPIDVGLAKAKELYDRGGLLVLDSREHEDFAAGHVKGAVAAHADEMMGDLEWLDKTAKDPRPILVYCDGGDCELSLNLSFELTQSGHRKVMVFTDGFPAWKDAGYPVEIGDMP
jgi:rhodanese-related sulfurtransferase